MNRSEREQEYAAILDGLNRIRAGVIADSQQELMFTGMMNPEAQKELKTVAEITAAVFMGLAQNGVPVTEDPSNPALAVITVGQKTFNCLKAQLNGVSADPAPAQATVAPLPAPEVRPASVLFPEQKTAPVTPVMPKTAEVPAREAELKPATEPAPAPVQAPPQKAEEPVREEVEEVISQADDDDNGLSVDEPVSNDPVEASRPQTIDDFLPQDQVSHTQMSAEEYAMAMIAAETGSATAPKPKPIQAPEPEPEPEAEPEPVPEEEPAVVAPKAESKPAPAPAPVPVEKTEPEVYTPEPAPAVPRRPADSAVQETQEAQGVVSLSDDDDNTSTVGNEPIVEAPVITGKAKVIGGGPVNVSMGINKEEFFLDEQSKKESEFVYCFSKLSVMHTDMGGGGRPEEMLVMVAPLKIYKYASTSVPIVVTIVHNGKSVTASSYDILEEGKNIVTIDIDEFYFLCRGSFDDKGKFKASIVTTGISSQQGDRITPLFSKTYGNGAAKETRNGHIKFHYTADSGPGSVEVIPFGVQGDRSEDFVAIIKNTEFVDYYLVSKSLKANTRAIIYSEGGVMNELVCHWEDDTLIADLI